MAEAICSICNTPRSQHGGRQHVFTDSEFPDLVQKRNEPPARRQAVSDQVASRTILRMVHVLVSKGLLTGEELAFIFGKDDDNGSSDSNGVVAGSARGGGEALGTAGSGGPAAAGWPDPGAPESFAEPH